MVWDGKNDVGFPLAKGIYFLRLKVGASYISKKIILWR